VVVGNRPDFPSFPDQSVPRTARTAAGDRLVITMLFERRNLRDRLIGLIGHGQLSARPRRSTKRHSRQQAVDDAVLVNAIYGLSPQ
jgi:hypothetical protein